MDRREALKRTALLMGGVISAPAIMGVLKGCTAQPGVDWKPAFLTSDQATVVSQVSEIIIPRTDTPGARDANTHRIIDRSVRQADRKVWKDGLAWLHPGDQKFVYE